MRLLAWHGDRWTVYAGKGELAKHLGVSVRHVDELTRSAIARGDLELMRRGGGHSPNVYRLAREANLTNQEIRRGRAYSLQLCSVFDALDELEAAGKLPNDLEGLSRCAMRVVLAAHWQRANDEHGGELWSYVTRGGKPGQFLADCFGMSRSEAFRALRALQLLGLARVRKALGSLPTGAAAGRNQVIRRPMLPSTTLRLVERPQVVRSWTPAQEAFVPPHTRDASPLPTPAHEGPLRTPEIREQLREPSRARAVGEAFASRWRFAPGWVLRTPVLREIESRLAEGWTVERLRDASTRGLERHSRGADDAAPSLRDPHAIFRSPALLDELLELAHDSRFCASIERSWSGSSSPAPTTEQRSATLEKIASGKRPAFAPVSFELRKAATA